MLEVENDTMKMEAINKNSFFQNIFQLHKQDISLSKNNLIIFRTN